LQFRTKSRPTAASVATLLLDRNPSPQLSEGRIDLVLSPSLYWFRNAALPAKTVYQAKKLAPSVMEGVIPAGEYSYHVIKQENTFWLFAYDEELIAETVKQAGIRASDVRNVYFAQTECDAATAPLKINERKALSSADGIVVELPAKYAATAETAASFFRSRPRSGHKVGISLYHTTLLDKRQLKKLTAVAALFAFLYGAEYLTAQKRLDAVLSKQESITETYKLPQTTFEIDGLVRALETKQKRQTLLREKAAALFAVPPGDGNRIARLTLTERKIALEVELAEGKEGQQLKSKLARTVKITSEKPKGKLLMLEAAYE